MKDNLIITCIGSRSINFNDEVKIKAISEYLLDINAWIRSGHAPGADIEFEKRLKNRTIVYMPWRGFNGRFYTDKAVYPLDKGSKLLDESENFLKENHTKYDYLSSDRGRGVKKLFLRNYFQITGTTGVLSNYVICVADLDKNNKEVGGTGYTCKIARSMNIPIINIRQENNIDSIIERINNDNT